jgi:hypothetical protein
MITAKRDPDTMGDAAAACVPKSKIETAPRALRDSL